MNYIVSKINQELEIKQVIDHHKHEIAQLHRIKIEFYLLYILGYLWNKQFRNLADEETRQYIINKITRPSLGDLIEICRKLDLENEVFSDKKLIPTFFDYTKLRNEKLGHGYLLEDGLDEYIKDLLGLIEKIEKSKIDLISKPFDIISVLNEDEKNFLGISLKAGISSIKPWLQSKSEAQFEINNVYITTDYKEYFKISPFIHVLNKDEFFLFRCVEEKLNGRVDLNCIDKTKTVKINWIEFPSFWELSDGKKKISGNGTIVNLFTNNFRNYIKIGSTKKKLEDFLANKSSVCATVWGHGGVGKTATIQSVCQDLFVTDKKKFDYLIFLSAKDRFYNYYKGEIETVDERIDNYENIIEIVNEILFDELVFDEQRIIDFNCKLLLVIDDFETYSKEDQKKIEAFIERLDINRQKIILTTRISNLKIGTEIQTNELNEIETRAFAIELIKTLYPTIEITQKEKELNNNENYKAVYQITNGRPLFIFQFVIQWMKTGSIDNSISIDIKSQKNAIDFLYGRIYQSLEKESRDMFDAISVLVNENDLSNLIEKLKYILNKEKDEDTFNKSITQLSDLLIIKVENDFFTIHSKEILEIMNKSFNKRNDTFIRFIKDRLNQVGRSKELDTDLALLRTADTYKTSRSETEVESIYRQILNRSSCKKEIQLKALINLSEYWFTYRGNKEKAIKTLDEYEIKFYDEPFFIKKHSNYCWAQNQRNKSVKILTSYFELKPTYKLEINLDLLALLVIYKSISTLDEREELKSKKKFNQVSDTDYNMHYNNQKAAFRDIYNFYSQKLLDVVKNIKISELKPGTRQNISTGYYQLVEVCCRLNKLEDAIAICDYALTNFPNNFYKQFSNAKKRVNKYIAKAN
jgi:GTPase SAR1 family protein